MASAALHTDPRTHPFLAALLRRCFTGITIVGSSAAAPAAAAAAAPTAPASQVVSGAPVRAVLLLVPEDRCCLLYMPFICVLCADGVILCAVCGQVRSVRLHRQPVAVRRLQERRVLFT
jgi:hypothetical protein